MNFTITLDLKTIIILLVLAVSLIINIWFFASRMTYAKYKRNKRKLDRIQKKKDEITTQKEESNTLPVPKKGRNKLSTIEFLTDKEEVSVFDSIELNPNKMNRNMDSLTKKYAKDKSMKKQYSIEDKLRPSEITITDTKSLSKKREAIKSYILKKELIGRSTYILDLCITVPIYEDDSIPIEQRTLKYYQHSLPLKDESKYPTIKENWNLPEKEIEKIDKFCKDMDKYAELIASFYNEAKSLSLIGELSLILPPWLVYPLYSGFASEWKTGRPKLYKEMFRGFVIGMTDSEKNQYGTMFSTPDYLETNFLELPQEMYE